MTQVVARDVADDVRRKALLPVLTVHKSELKGVLPDAWSAAEIEAAATKLASELTQVGLPMSANAELIGLLPLLRLLMQHAKLGHAAFSEWDQTSKPRERFFADHLDQFLRMNGIEKTYRPYCELPNQPGRIDLAFMHRELPDLQFVVELKSEDLPFSRIVDDHGGQPMAYCTHEYARISILYAQFGGDTFRLSDAIAVRQLRTSISDMSEGSRLAAICIGQHAFGRIPSGSGKQSSPATKRASRPANG